MKTLKKNTSFSILIFTILFSQNIFSQSSKTIIEQDEKIEKLLQEKRKNNSGITINDKFKIQIFFGNIEESKKTLLAFKKEFPLLNEYDKQALYLMELVKTQISDDILRIKDMLKQKKSRSKSRSSSSSRSRSSSSSSRSRSSSSSSSSRSRSRSSSSSSSRSRSRSR